MGVEDGAGAGPARPGAAAPGLSVYTEALGAEIAAAVAEGSSLGKVCAQPGRPHRTTVRNWEKARPEFREVMRAAYRRARIGARMRQRQQVAELAARRLVEGGPARGGRASGYTEALGEVICARLAEGETLTSIARDADMPSYGTIYAWLKRHPEFEDMYVEAREAQAEYFCDEARDTVRAATRETVPVARLGFDMTRWQAARQAPKKYLDRLVAAEALAELGIGPRGGVLRGGGRAEDAPRNVVFHVTHFERGPNNTVLAAPPRNAREAQAWIDATGAPYAEGIGPNGQMRPPAIPFFKD